MPNGFLSQLAAARSSQQALGGLAGLQLRKTGLEEQRALEDEIRRMEERLKEEQDSARKREGRRGRGRLAGLLAGAGLALATGGTSLAVGLAGGLGSAAGQELGARGLGTKEGLGSRKRRLGRIKSGLEAPGLFFRGKRADIETQRQDLNKFLRDADRQFNQQILTSAVTDAFSAGKFAGSEMGKQAGQLLRGETTLRDIFKAGVGRVPKKIRDKEIMDKYENLRIATERDRSFRDLFDPIMKGNQLNPNFDPLSVDPFFSDVITPGFGFGGSR